MNEQIVGAVTPAVLPLVTIGITALYVDEFSIDEEDRKQRRKR